MFCLILIVYVHFVSNADRLFNQMQPVVKWLIFFLAEPCHDLCGFARIAALHPPPLPVIPNSRNSWLWAQGGYISPCTPCLALLAWNINPEGPDGRGHSNTYCGAMSLVTSVFLWSLHQAIRRAVSQERTGQESHRKYGKVTGFFFHGFVPVFVRLSLCE